MGERVPVMPQEKVEVVTAEVRLRPLVVAFAVAARRMVADLAPVLAALERSLPSTDEARWQPGDPQW